MALLKCRASSPGHTSIRRNVVRHGLPAVTMKGCQQNGTMRPILSCFNAFMDADALGLNAMPNASFYQHYPLAPYYPQNPKPTKAGLIARGLLDAKGQVVPHAYVAFYVGDYDSSAWLYHRLPSMWSGRGRGSTPLSWAFNPNLSGRFPLGMALARARGTTNDWFVGGDLGGGR